MKAGRPYEFGLDLLRITAMGMAFILHFYYENGFYYQPVSSASMIFHVALRDICFCCVPLFLMITGYLKCGQEWKKGYYRSLGPVMISWLIISLLCGTFRVLFEHQQWTLKDWFTQLTGFEMTSYSWYLNMYFGLFLLSPFINLVWNKLETREKRQRLLALLMLITFCATTVNAVIKTLPDYWTGLWPFAYYLLGCYIKTYRPTLQIRLGIPVMIGTAGIYAVLNMITGGRAGFTKGYGPSYGNILGMGLTVLVFCTLYQSDCRLEKIRSTVKKLAPLALNMILASRIFTTLLFPQRYTNYGPDQYLFQGIWRIGLSLAASWCIASPVHCFSHWLISRAPSLYHQEKERIRVRQAVIFSCILAGLVLLLWKCRYGFGNIDEAFYLTIPIRLCLGDALLVEEWHVSQLSSLLLYPIMWVYRLFFGTSQQGIVLHFRYIYVGVQFAVSIFLYSRWKRLSEWGALPAAIVFLLFAPYGISALSYNSMGIICVVLSLTVFVTGRRHRYVQEIISGILFAGAVLCCPSFVIVYFLYGAAVIISRTFFCRKKGIGDGFLAPARFLRVTGGCAVLAVIFAVFVLSRTSGTRILQSIPEIMGDSAHSLNGWWYRIWHSVSYVLGGKEEIAFCSALFFLLLVWSAFDRKRMQRRWLYWLLGCGIVFAHMVCTIQNSTLINAVTVSVTLLPLLSMILIRDEKITGIFWSIWLPGVLYSLCITMVSNQSYLAMQTGLVVSSAAGILIVARTIRTLLEEDSGEWWLPVRRFLLMVSGVIFIGVMLGSEGWHRYSDVFWGGDVTAQTEAVTEGPEAGLYVTKDKMEKYEAVRTDFQLIQEREPEAESAALLTDQCWYYLFSDWEYGAYSAWLSVGHVDVAERLIHYYDMNPHKLPDLILADKDLSLDWQALAEQLGYSIKYDSQLFHVLRR